MLLCVFQIDLGKQPEVSRREPVSAEEWAKNMDSEGRILDVDYIKRLIFKGVTRFSKFSKTYGLILAFIFLPELWMCGFHYTCNVSCRTLSISQAVIIEKLHKAWFHANQIPQQSCSYIKCSTKREILLRLAKRNELEIQKLK